MHIKEAYHISLAEGDAIKILSDTLHQGNLADGHMAWREWIGHAC